MTFLFAAYTLIWVLLFGYVVSIARRQKKVQDELNQVQEWLNRHPQK
jgi:CcmD family protein